MESDGRVIEEHWMEPYGGTLIGMGRTVKGGETLFFEYLRIERRPDWVYFVAQPRGNPPVSFRLVEGANNSVLFENLKHDFPQRIRYTCVSENELVAEVSGPQGGKTVSEKFDYRRMK